MLGAPAVLRDSALPLLCCYCEPLDDEPEVPEPDVPGVVEVPEPDVPGVVEELELGGVVAEPPEPVAPEEVELLPEVDGLFVDEPEPPAGGIAELPLLLGVPEPEPPPEPVLSPQPTSASVPSTTPASSVRLYMNLSYRNIRRRRPPALPRRPPYPVSNDLPAAEFRGNLRTHARVPRAVRSVRQPRALPAGAGDPAASGRRRDRVSMRPTIPLGMKMMKRMRRIP